MGSTFSEKILYLFVSFLECMECVVGAMTTVAVGCWTHALLSLVMMWRKESCVSSDEDLDQEPISLNSRL